MPIWGANAAGDWAADKRIDLPSLRGRPIVGLDGMGAARANVLTHADADVLGTALGAETVALTGAQNGPHTHTGTTNAAGSHSHGVTIGGSGSLSSGGVPVLGPQTTTWGFTTNAAGLHNHPFTTASAGLGEPHNNLQPSLLVTIYIKL
jgi:microcystin-dependent protein